jgi:hypothetical protein
MKIFRKFAVPTLAMLAVTAAGFSQEPPAKAPLNLVRGVVGPVSSSNNWSGYSALNQIPGGGLIPVTSSTAAFYLGFTAGTTADVSNIVLYTTARNSLKITAVTPVTYGGVSNPSINLGSTTVCKVQPLSAASPCIVRLDPLTVTLSALSDYYLVVYFKANDSNNSAVGGAIPNNYVSSLTGWFISADETQLTVGQSIPSGLSQSPYFLMFVRSN